MSKAGQEWDAVRAEWSSNRKGQFKAIRVYSLAGNWDWDLTLKIISFFQVFKNLDLLSAMLGPGVIGEGCVEYLKTLKNLYAMCVRYFILSS